LDFSLAKAQLLKLNIK